jgi:hypothetical protein
MKLILEKVAEQNKKAIVVTTDPITQNLSGQIGVTYQPTVSKVGEDDWHNNKIKPEKTDEKPQPTNPTDSKNSETAENFAQKQRNKKTQKVETEKPKEKVEIRTEKGFSMAVGSDIQSAQVSAAQPKQQRVKELAKKEKQMIGKDWSRTAEKKGLQKKAQPKPVKKPKKEVYKRKRGIKQQLEKSSSKKITEQIGKIFKSKALLLGIIISLIGGIGFFLYYYFLVPSVTVKLYPENVDVSFDGEIFAKETTTEGSTVENMTISNKIEDIESSRSKSGDATQTQETGDKASGSVNFYYNGAEDLTLPVGTIVTSSDGLQFQTTKEETLTKGETNVVTIEATTEGEEYNLSAGKRFTVEGQDETTLWGENGTEITGGFSEEITVVGKEDVLRIGKELEEELEKELEQRLKDLHASDQWILVEDSIEFEKPGEGVDRFETVEAIGSENTIVNVTATLSAKAVYYNNNELEVLVEKLLEEDYSEKREEENQIVNATLDNETIEISSKKVKKIENENITLGVKAKGTMRTQIDQDEILTNLQDKRWDEGLQVLKELPAMSKEPEVIYSPENYPEKLKHFPAQKSKINIEFVNE